MPIDVTDATTIRRMTDLFDDALVLARYQMGRTAAAALLTAEHYSPARPQPGEAAALPARQRPQAPTPAEQPDDPARWPVIGQREFRNRVQADRATIAEGTAFGTDRAWRSAARRLEPWLAQLSDTLAGAPLSEAALEIACEQWRQRRDPYFADPQRARCRVTTDPQPPPGHGSPHARHNTRRPR